MVGDKVWDLFIAHAAPDQAAAVELYTLLEPYARVFLDCRRLNLAACGASLGTWAKTCAASTSSVRRIGAWRWGHASSGRSKREFGSRTRSWQPRRDIRSTRS